MHPFVSVCVYTRVSLKPVDRFSWLSYVAWARHLLKPRIAFPVVLEEDQSLMNQILTTNNKPHHPLKHKHKVHIMPSLASWWLSSQWRCLAFPLHLSLHLLSKGRSANWPAGCLRVCWMQRKSALLEAWQACCLCTSVLWLVSLQVRLNTHQHIAASSTSLLWPHYLTSIGSLLAVSAVACPLGCCVLLQSRD